MYNIATYNQLPYNAVLNIARVLFQVGKTVVLQAQPITLNLKMTNKDSLVLK